MIGKLNQRVTIEQKSVTRNGLGDEVVAWLPITTVWAAVEPLRGTEYMAARQAQSDVTVKVTMRYYGGLDTTMRLRHRHQALNVISIINPGMQDRWLEVLCNGDSEAT